jgi:hypothetical protein
MDYESEIKAYQAETPRISAVQAGMSEEQIQDIVAGTIAAAIHTGDLIGDMPEMEMPDFEEGRMSMQGMQPHMPPEQPQQEMMQ